MTEAYTYKAFISYSHADKLAGKKLMKQLENYRVPKRLVGTPVKVGIRKEIIGTPIPARVGQLFRDREELAAAESLTEEVLRALSRSEFMIVLCSPKAAASRWVNREIIEFKKLTGERRILSVILSGEPFATDNGDPANECFPPALRYKLGENGQLTDTSAEPLAADFRPEGDGEKRGALKLIAGLLGISLDTLIERDLQRKYRRVTFLTAASVIATLSMGLLTYEAVTAREEAERNRMRAEAAQAEAEKNRGEAEGLIEFMLTDLRDKLEPVGRLDVLDAVGAKAVDYYDRQVLKDMPDDAVGRRSRAFHELGRIQNLQGKRDEAQGMFDRAYQATKTLLNRNPNNENRIFEHSQSAFWVGFMDYEKGYYRRALPVFQNYFEYSEKLSKLNPTSFKYRLELMYAHSTLGSTYLGLDMPETAYIAFSKMISIGENLLSETSIDSEQYQDIQYELTQNLALMADCIDFFGSVHTSLELRQKELKLLNSLLEKQPDRRDLYRDLLANHRALRRNLAIIGLHDQANGFLKEGLRFGKVLWDLENEDIWVRDTLASLIVEAATDLYFAKDYSRADQLVEKYRDLLNYYTNLNSLAGPHQHYVYFGLAILDKLESTISGKSQGLFRESLLTGLPSDLRYHQQVLYKSYEFLISHTLYCQTDAECDGILSEVVQHLSTVDKHASPLPINVIHTLSRLSKIVKDPEIRSHFAQMLLNRTVNNQVNED